MGRTTDLLTRMAIPKAGLGNLLVNPASQGGSRGKNRVTGATGAVSFVSEGQPLNLDWNGEELAKNGYNNSVYVMRCVRTIAETIASLPWVAGPDPTQPANYNPQSALARFLGPSTPQAPGGPNPDWAARAFWINTICQYLVTGRFGWETTLSPRPGTRGKKDIVEIWPLVSFCLSPKPTLGGHRYFNGYEYNLASGKVNFRDEQVIYRWRPSITDPRMPESVLQAAALPIFLHTSIDRYMAGLLRNGMTATTMVITPPFARPQDRRAFHDQFSSQFTGVDRAGNAIFTEVDEDDDGPGAGKPAVQVERIATTPVDAALRETRMDALNDICIALGVPRSLIGDASQRIYSNSEAEYRNFWTLTVLNMIAELQDHVNLSLALRLGGQEVGWFDLSRVAALQPPSAFQPPMVGDLINFGIATPDQIANVLQIPPAYASKDADTDTVPIGELSTGGLGLGGGGSGRAQQEIHTPYGEDWTLRLRRWQAEEWWRSYCTGKPRQTAVNTHVLMYGSREPLPTRPHITVSTRAVSAKHLVTSGTGIDKAANAVNTAMEIKDKLANRREEPQVVAVHGGGALVASSTKPLDPEAWLEENESWLESILADGEPEPV